MTQPVAEGDYRLVPHQLSGQFAVRRQTTMSLMLAANAHETEAAQRGTSGEPPGNFNDPIYIVTGAGPRSGMFGVRNAEIVSPFPGYRRGTGGRMTRSHLIRKNETASR